MFGIFIQQDNNNDFENKIKSLFDEFNKKDNKYKAGFIMGFLLFFLFLFMILFIFMFSVFYFSAFAWNNSFVPIFNLPTLSWVNVAFGYLFTFVFYKLIKFLFW